MKTKSLFHAIAGTQSAHGRALVPKPDMPISAP